MSCNCDPHAPMTYDTACPLHGDASPGRLELQMFLRGLVHRWRAHWSFPA